MACILFFPAPEFGHLNPTLKLAKNLKAKGHRIYYVGLKEFEEYVVAQGMEYVPILQQRYPDGYFKKRIKEKTEYDYDTLDLVLSEAEGCHGRAAFDLYSELEKEFAALILALAPDLLLLDFMLRNLLDIMLKKLGLQTCILSTTFLHSSSITGAEEPGDTEGPAPELFICPKELDFPTRIRPHRRYIECSVDLLRAEKEEFPWEKLDGRRKLVYCSLGSQAHQNKQSRTIFRAVFEALASMPGWQLVVAIGTHIDEEEFAPQPENVIVVRWAPQIRLLQKANIMITHAGLGAVKECVLMGVPMIAFPCRWDQPFNAERIVYHGIGVKADMSQVSAGQVRSLVEAVHRDAEYKARIDRMSQLFRQIETSGIGVRTVEEMVQRAVSCQQA